MATQKLLDAARSGLLPLIQGAPVTNEQSAVMPVQAGAVGQQPSGQQWYDMKPGGGKMVGEAETPWYKDPNVYNSLALGFNSMRLNPDQGLAAALQDRIKTAQEMSGRNKTAVSVADALRKQGRNDEAALIEANPDMAKTVLSAMFTGDRAKNFTFMSGDQLNKERNTNVFDPKKPYKVSSTGEISEIGGGGTAITINPESKGDVKWEEASAGAISKKFESYMDQGGVAADIVPEIQTLQELASIAPNGPLSGRFAETFRGFSTAGDAFQSVIARVAPKMRVPGSGASSDKDVDFLVQSLGALKNAPGANALIYQAFLDKSNIDMRRAEIASDAFAGRISRKEALDQINLLNRQSIISPELKAMIEATKNQGGGAVGPAGMRPPEVGTVIGGKRFKGGNPSDKNNWE